MKYYTIQNNSILTADNKQALTRFYDNVFLLPDDYIKGKYIIENNKLVLNPNWEEEEKQKQKDIVIVEIKKKLEKLDTKRIRAICENEIKDEDTGKTWLEYYNEQVVELRQQLSKIEK